MFVAGSKWIKMYEMHPGETLSARQLHNSCAVSPGITAGPPMRQVRARSGSCPNHSASGLQPSARRHLAAAALSLSARDGRSHFLTGSRSRHERRERTTSRPLANGTVVDRPQRLEHGALLVARTWDPTRVVAGGAAAGGVESPQRRRTLVPVDVPHRLRNTQIGSN